MIKQESARLKVEPLEARVMMAFDTYLKIEGVPGEATVKGKGGAIEIESWSWGETNYSPPPGSGGGSGKNLVVTKVHDKATPLLAKACATGQHIKKATLFVRKSGGGQEEYMKYTLQDCFVSSYQTSGGGGTTTDLPTEGFSLNYSKISFTYTKQSPERGKRHHSGLEVVKIVEPTLESRGPDLNGDGTDDPVFFNYAVLRDMNRDLIVDLIVPNDANGDAQMDFSLLCDLNGDGAPDSVIPPVDSDGDGTPDMVLHVDTNGSGPPDLPIPVDQDNDGYVDDLILVDLNGDGKADLIVGYYTGRTTHF